MELYYAVVTSDQGQSEIGWHPMIDEDSWVTPLVFVGPGIAKGRQLPYFEHTDISPTIAHLFNLPYPSTDGGAGKFVKEILAQNDTAGFTDPQYIRQINQQIIPIIHFVQELYWQQKRINIFQV